MSTTLNVLTNNLTVDVVDNSPTVNTVFQTITLDIESGGIVPANIDIALEAAENISALRCITSDSNGRAVYATPDTVSNALVIGISQNAANQGDNVTIRTSGLMTDAGWSWTKGTVYLSTNGALTQTAPTGGDIIVPVAKALTATTIQIDIDTTIQTV